MTASVLVVVPTYNERATLDEVLARLRSAPVDADVLVVDDGSPDGTGAVADRAAARDGRVHVLHRPRREGLGAAYRAGLGWGLAHGYDVLVEMDADLSHDPAQLPQIIGATSLADVVVGSRYVAGGRIDNWVWHRRLLSWGGNRYVQAVTGIPVRDATSGFRAYRRSALEAVCMASVRSDGYAFQVEMVLRAWRLGFAVTEVPITFVERRSGASKISRAIVFEALWRVLWWGWAGSRRPAGRHPRSVAASR